MIRRELTDAQWLRIDCSGTRQETLARKGGADLIILDRPFFERKTDAELATFDSHAGAIVHEITHLGGIGHLPGCSGALTAAQCFDFALERAAADDPAVLNSAHNYEFLFVNK